MRLTRNKVRELTADEIGIAPPPSPEPDPGQEPAEQDDAEFDINPLPDDNEYLQTTNDLLTTWGGVILVGPPGTSKSYYAARLARTIAGDISRVRFVQFHPSYQYEDFVIGYVPKDDGSGFELLPKHLMQWIKKANDEPDETFVIVIDELSRGEPGRIFGEALTYVEKTKRGQRFNIAAGREVSIPPNLVFICTMNPLDRGVDEVDAAFERRFAKIPMDPSETILQGFLVEAGMPSWQRTRVLDFFRTIANKAKNNPYAALGHTFFLDVGDEDGLRRVWTHQLRFLFDKAFRLDRDGFNDVERAWEKVVAPHTDPITAPAPEAGTEESSSAEGTEENAAAPSGEAATPEPGTDEPPNDQA